MKKHLPQIKEFSKKILVKMLVAIILTLTVGGTIWAIAAFTEPTSGPAASVQDFAKNIMGANNADNAFDSGSVVANADGSIIERLEGINNKTSGDATAANQNAILGRLNGFNALSARSVAAYNIAGAANYCYNLSVVAEYTLDGSSTATTYTDWRLPTVSELAVFLGRTMDTNFLWAASVRDATLTNWITLSLSDGTWTNDTYSRYSSVRCVR